MIEVGAAVAKIPKYAVQESGDSVEMIERPRGGLSLVIADGQRSGRSAKAISNVAVRKAVSLLAEGVRDGAVARAAHDYLRTHRDGKVSAELVLLSIDLETRTLVISRNSHCPVLFAEGDTWRVLDDPAPAVGVRVHARPVITELALAAGQTVIAFTDGVTHAGARRGLHLDALEVVQGLACQPDCSAQELADGLLAAALELDQGRPQDDITVVVLQTVERAVDDKPQIRRMRVSFPVSGI
jgi:serine phosphatase RsbU (regulator of sigma subunit)